MHADLLFDQGNQQLSTGQWAEAITSFSLLLQQQPEDWQALANRAQAYFRSGAYDKSLDDYCLALNLRPGSVNLLTNFSVLLKELGQLELAENLLRQALQLEPEHADAWSNLGSVLLYRMQYDQASQCHIHAMELAGASAARWNNLGNALTGGLHLEDAVEAYDHALALDPDCHDARYNQSIPLLLLGRYLQAWPQYEARWQCILTPRLTDLRWRGENLEHKTLLIWSEQGLGDSLQMVRFIPLIHARFPSARLILSCPASLQRLFSRFDFLDVVDSTVTPPHDWQLPLASLPGVLHAETGNLPLQPYLSADPQLIAQWATRLPPRRSGVARIGLVWQSGVWGVGVRDLCRQQKSIADDLLSPLFGQGDLISLQPDPLPPLLVGQVHPCAIGDFADTAALIANLDLVISVDTAVAHLAGGMGKPVWVLMRHEGAPFFGAEGEHAPWYPSARIWRQSQPGDWPAVLQQVRLALPLFLSGRAE
jgi:tetratricopeptide (TPR) repeat protein